MSFMDYKPYEQDYRFWLVVNPTKWLMPMAFTVLGVALAVHVGAFSLKGGKEGWTAKTAPVAVAAPAPVAK